MSKKVRVCSRCFDKESDSGFLYCDVEEQFYCGNCNKIFHQEMNPEHKYVASEDYLFKCPRHSEYFSHFCHSHNINLCLSCLNSHSKCEKMSFSELKSKDFSAEKLTEKLKEMKKNLIKSGEKVDEILSKIKEAFGVWSKRATFIVDFCQNLVESYDKMNKLSYEYVRNMDEIWRYFSRNKGRDDEKWEKMFGFDVGEKLQEILDEMNKRFYKSDTNSDSDGCCGSIKDCGEISGVRECKNAGGVGCNVNKSVLNTLKYSKSSLLKLLSKTKHIKPTQLDGLSSYKKTAAFTNSILFSLEINSSDVSKDIYFLCDQSNNCNTSYNELSENNCNLYINGKSVGFRKCFRFEKTGKYEVEYEILGDISSCEYMFFNCYKITHVNLENFNSLKHISNCAYMFANCKNLREIVFPKSYLFNPSNISFRTVAREL